jgi:hypothetical protein
MPGIAAVQVKGRHQILVIREIWGCRTGSIAVAGTYAGWVLKEHSGAGTKAGL